MRPPVLNGPVALVDSDGWVSVFDSIADLLSYTEPNDVLDEKLAIFDGAGRRAILRRCPGGAAGQRQAPSVEVEAVVEVDKDAASELMLSALADAGVVVAAGLSLAEILEVAREHRRGISVGHADSNWHL
jgi:hypothetical protein